MYGIGPISNYDYWKLAYKDDPEPDYFDEESYDYEEEEPEDADY